MVSTREVRRLLQRFGNLRPQRPASWKGENDLPASLAEFYTEVGPLDIEIEGYGNSYLIPRLSKLWAFQAGYRWNGITLKPIKGWNPDWLVVAAEGSDPFILSRKTGRVSFCYCGSGTWKPTPVFSDVLMTAACLATLGAVVQDAGSSLTDDELMIRPKHRNVALARLRKYVGSERAAMKVLELAGW